MTSGNLPTRTQSKCQGRKLKHLLEPQPSLFLPLELHCTCFNKGQLDGFNSPIQIKATRLNLTNTCTCTCTCTCIHVYTMIRIAVSLQSMCRADMLHMYMFNPPPQFSRLSIQCPALMCTCVYMCCFLGAFYFLSTL